VTPGLSTDVAEVTVDSRTFPGRGENVAYAQLEAVLASARLPEGAEIRGLQVGERRFHVFPRPSADASSAGWPSLASMPAVRYHFFTEMPPDRLFERHLRPLSPGFEFRDLRILHALEAFNIYGRRDVSPGMANWLLPRGSDEDSSARRVLSFLEENREAASSLPLDEIRFDLERLQELVRRPEYHQFRNAFLEMENLESEIYHLENRSALSHAEETGLEDLRDRSQRLHHSLRQLAFSSRLGASHGDGPVPVLDCSADTALADDEARVLREIRDQLPEEFRRHPQFERFLSNAWEEYRRNSGMTRFGRLESPDYPAASFMTSLVRDLRASGRGAEIWRNQPPGEGTRVWERVRDSFRRARETGERR
jgi:hypothetical protein